MKKNWKTLTLASAATVLAISLGACSQNNGKNRVADFNDEDQVYTGVLPGADTDGIRYTLRLDYDDDHNNTEGDYKLVETYLAADSLNRTGLKDLKSFKSEGDFTVENKDGKKYLKLVQDRKDSSVGSAEGPLYFLVDSDSTLTLVGENLQISETPGLNYTLKIVK